MRRSARRAAKEQLCVINTLMICTDNEDNAIHSKRSSTRVLPSDEQQQMKQSFRTLQSRSRELVRFNNLKPSWYIFAISHLPQRRQLASHWGCDIFRINATKHLQSQCRVSTNRYQRHRHRYLYHPRHAHTRTSLRGKKVSSRTYEHTTAHPRRTCLHVRAPNAALELAMRDNTDLRITKHASDFQISHSSTSHPMLPNLFGSSAFEVESQNDTWREPPPRNDLPL